MFQSGYFKLVLLVTVFSFLFAVTQTQKYFVPLEQSLTSILWLVSQDPPRLHWLFIPGAFVYSVPFQNSKLYSTTGSCSGRE